MMARLLAALRQLGVLQQRVLYLEQRVANLEQSLSQRWSA